MTALFFPLYHRIGRRAKRGRFPPWFAMLFVSMLFGCSASSPIKPAPLQTVPLAYQNASVPRIGDAIEVNYYPSSQLEDRPYVVNVGDVLRVDVMDHPELTRERILVLPDGYISVPMISRFAAAGKNLDEVAAELKGIYRSHRIVDPMVTVSVEQADSQLDTLMRSISRNGRVEPFVVTVDESGILDLPFITPVSAYQPFDKIRAEIRAAYRQKFGERLEVTANLNRRQPPVVYVIGEVMNPGSINYAQPLAPLMAVAAAGGFRTSAKRSDIRVLRYGPEGHLEQWTLDMDVAMQSDQPLSLELLPRDIIYVPKTGVAEANDVIEQYVRKMIPLSIGFGFNYQLNQQN